jgi:hypothetical protein
MAQYRALHTINANGQADAITGATNWPTIPPNTVFSDQAGDSVPQMVPQGWTPSSVDPLNQDAIQKVWNAGPYQLMGLKTAYRPSIYWAPFPSAGGTRPMQLTGAGASLGPRNWTDTRGAAP